MCFTFVPFRGRTGEHFYSTSIDWGSVNREREAGLYPTAVNWVCLRADMLQDEHGMRLWLKGQHSQHSQLQAAWLCMSTATSVTNNILYGYYIKKKKKNIKKQRQLQNGNVNKPCIAQFKTVNSSVGALTLLMLAHCTVKMSIDSHQRAMPLERHLWLICSKWVLWYHFLIWRSCLQSLWQKLLTMII